MKNKLSAAGVVGISLALVAVMSAGCSSSVQGVVPEQDALGRYVIHMTNNLTFSPAEAKVPPGARVVWINDATVEHDVNGYAGDPAGERTEFSSSLVPPHGDGRILGPGAEYEHVFPAAGTWTIWCHAHHEERMKGLVHVG